MKNEKEVWIENMMAKASTRGSNRETKHEVLDKILKSLDQPEPGSSLITYNHFRLIGAAALLILALNLGIIGSAIIQKSDSMGARATYGLENFNLNLY
ncbi:MAG: hypothetical protein V4721_12585 [Bacteroidota bacterium]